jgi:hypothetical protein
MAADKTVLWHKMELQTPEVVLALGSHNLQQVDQG